ncbi:hypothetical protein LSTR_LSTR014399 [Laodelphax striatellus]|uniref:Uncharacterized protein n=1 Tax=Laodelphax striatellus TaxID=195883 RepID=A0A482WT48_LAOST|nr:hypothetical protein LSTR_LSTR014399 [Laodelphax striatellus]
MFVAEPVARLLRSVRGRGQVSVRAVSVSQPSSRSDRRRQRPAYDTQTFTQNPRNVTESAQREKDGRQR